jgi:hypothetical protein
MTGAARVNVQVGAILAAEQKILIPMRVAGIAVIWSRADAAVQLGDQLVTFVVVVS